METFPALLALFPRYWPFVRSPVNFPHKGQWRGTSMFSLICAWIYGWANNHEAGDWRRYRAHYDVTVMTLNGICPRWCVEDYLLFVHAFQGWIDFRHLYIDFLSQDWNRACCWILSSLTHWGQDKLVTIFQTTFSNAFSWMKMYKFRLRSHWSLLQGSNSQCSSIGSDTGLAPSRQQAIIWTNDG